MALGGQIGQAVGDSVAALLPIITGLIGQAMAAGDEAEVKRLKQLAVANYGPDILPQLERMVAEQQQGTAYDQADPATRDAQMRALSRLEQESETGYTPQDAAAYARASQEAENVAGGLVGANEQRMAERGMAGSGAEIASNLSAQQGAIQRASNAGLQTAADSRTRALRALEGYGNMATNVRGQDLKRADAQDAINRLNTTIRQRATNYNTRLPQQQYENNLLRLRGLSGAQGDLADYYAKQAQNTRDTWRGIGEGIGEAASSVGRDMNKSDFDIGSLLSMWGGG